jgi:XisH protein
MPALDTCHHEVVRVLKMSGWSVRPTQKRLKIGRRIAYIDIVAEDARGTKRYVEVKCVPQVVLLSEQYGLVGQYLLYQEMLRVLRDPTELYLAVSSAIYLNRFDEVFRSMLAHHRIRVLLYDELEERVIEL